MRALLEISITNACTNACSYCIAKGTKQVAYSKYRIAEGGGIYIDCDAICSFVESMVEQCPEGVVVALTGGEPMCHPAFEQIVKKLSQITIRNNSRLVLYSNLQLMSGVRCNLINHCVDFVIAGFHPEGHVMGITPEHWHRCNAAWMVESIAPIFRAKVVNVIVGAYDNLPVEHKFTLDELENIFKVNEVPYVKTPLNRNIKIKGINYQFERSPDLVNVRADGSIVRCNGKPDYMGNIYEHSFTREMLCEEHCVLCPSYWCYKFNTDLFAEVV